MVKLMRIFVIATVGALLASCSTPAEDSQPSRSQVESLVQPTPTCSDQEFAEGSGWIKGQLAAFSDDSPEKAYSFASEEFRQSTSLEAFAAVIVNSYSMLLDLKTYRVISCLKSGELYTFEVTLTDNQGVEYSMEYILSRTGDQWGVDGASVSLKIE
jgi:hypothetical protein